jgi:hypothetical protein
MTSRLAEINDAGRLVYSPTVYCDAVVIVHYWAAYRFSAPRDESARPEVDDWRKAIQALYRADRHLPAMSNVRTLAGTSKLQLITSPLMTLAEYVRGHVRS